MSRKLVLLNLVLAAIACWLGWTLRERWLDAQAQERALFRNAARAKAVLPPPPLPPVPPVTPAEYIDVAQKTLFSKDRNPNVVIDTPPPKPEPPMPALPSYFGEITLGDPVILLAVASSAEQKSYHVGEKVGPFQLVAFDREKITLAWNGKTVEKRLEDLAPKQSALQQTAAATAPAPAAAAPVVKSLSPPGSSSDDSRNPQLGQDMGGGYRACAPGDKSPAGTVLDGYKKVISQGLMGESCFWQKADK